MPYVQIENGKIIGTYNVLQEGFAEEYRDDTDPDVVAFLTPSPPLSEEEPKSATEKLIAFLNHNPDVKALLGL